ncbi:MAG: DUF4242 domain-containing protein [Steroidobacteraceae bacterium]
MKLLIRLALACLLIGVALADQPVAHPHASSPTAGTSMHRYLVERTFPAGALAGLDAATKSKVNARNASVGVRWVKSYATADKTKTFCIYEGPSEQAVRKAAALNHLPVDRVIEIPVTLLPK